MSVACPFYSLFCPQFKTNLKQGLAAAFKPQWNRHIITLKLSWISKYVLGKFIFSDFFLHTSGFKSNAFSRLILGCRALLKCKVPGLFSVLKHSRQRFIQRIYIHFSSFNRKKAKSLYKSNWLFVRVCLPR